jgi:hypothetical protein
MQSDELTAIPVDDSMHRDVRVRTASQLVVSHGPHDPNTISNVFDAHSDNCFPQNSWVATVVMPGQNKGAVMAPSLRTHWTVLTRSPSHSRLQGVHVDAIVEYKYAMSGHPADATLHGSVNNEERKSEHCSLVKVTPAPPIQTPARTRVPLHTAEHALQSLRTSLGGIVTVDGLFVEVVEPDMDNVRAGDVLGTEVDDPVCILELVAVGDGDAVVDGVTDGHAGALTLQLCDTAIVANVGQYVSLTIAPVFEAMHARARTWLPLHVAEQAENSETITV